jgi:hypothetical protein
MGRFEVCMFALEWHQTRGTTDIREAQRVFLVALHMHSASHVQQTSPRLHRWNAGVVLP